MGFLSKFKSMDLLAQPVMLNFQGESTMKSAFGAAMTLLYILVLVLYSGNSIAKHFDLTNPNVLQLSIDRGQYPRINLDKKGILPVLFALDPNLKVLKPTDMKKYFTPIFGKRKVSTTVSFTGSMATEIDYITLGMIPCSELNLTSAHSSIYGDVLNTSTLGQMVTHFGMCIDMPLAEAYVKGGGADLELEYFSLDIFPCTLESGCATAEQVSKVTLVIGHPIHSVNYTNYENPIFSTISYDNAYFINPSLKQRFSSRLGLNELFNDRGIFYSKTLSAKYLSMEKVMPSFVSRNSSIFACEPKDVVSRACTSYLAFEFSSSGRSNTMVRRYTNLTQVLSEIGGINSVIWFIFVSATAIYGRLTRNKLIARQLFASLWSSPALGTAEPEGGGPPKSRSQREKTIEEVASTFVKNRLDVVEIIKELSNLRLLMELLLSDGQRKAAPLAFLAMDQFLLKSPAICEEGHSRGRRCFRGS